MNNEKELKQISKELNKLIKKQDKWDKKLKSIRDKDEKIKYVKETMSEFLEANKISDELLARMFDIIHNNYELLGEQPSFNDHNNQDYNLKDGQEKMDDIDKKIEEIDNKLKELDGREKNE